MTADEMRRTVLDVLAEIAPDADLPSLAADEDLRERLDIDSFDFLTFLVRLQETTGADVPERDAARLTTLEGAVAYLEDAVPADTRGG